MNLENIKAAIIKNILEIAPEIEEDEIENEANIQSSLEIDSFDFLKILTAMNEEFGVEVPEADYSKVATMQSMAEYFEQRT